MVADSRMINVGGHKVGVLGLDEVLEDMAPDFAQRPDQEVAAELMRRLKARNYIPAGAEERYAAAFLREFRRYLGQPYEAEARQGLEVRILGPGCPNCRQLHERVIRVLSRMGLSADVEKVEDTQAIAASGVLVTPALVINDKVVSSGRLPREDDIRHWLQEADKP